MSSRKDAILGYFRARLKFFVVSVSVVLIVSLAVGLVLFYLYRTGPDHAFKNLRVALSTGDKAGLAAMIDFRLLAEDVVRGVLAAHPQAAADEAQQAEMRDEAQRLVLKALAVGKDAKPEAVGPRKPFEPVPFVPEDVIAQFTAGMKLEKTPGAVQIRSQFTHYGLQADFPLRLLMERRKSGWLVTRLLNAQELVALYNGGMDTLRAGDVARLAEQNENSMDRMRAHFNSPQCLASVHLMGSQHETMLIVKVTAENRETTTLHHVNLLCEVRTANGSPVYSRNLNVVQRVYGGGSFSNTWTVVLDSDSEEAARLLQAGPLSCTVEPRVMSVGVGEVLYLRKEE